MSTSWFDFPTTQAHGVEGEQGIDLGTPFHTPITPLDPGVVESTQFGPFGGLITESTARGNEYYLHEDTIDVVPGEPVSTSTVLGLSGGQLSGGAHPAEPAYSSGPHTEFGLFTGTPFASAAVDPTGLIDAARAGTSAPAGSGGVLPSFVDPSSIINGIGHGLANALTAAVSDVGTFFKRQIIALAVAVVVAIVLFA